jgi:hypothetical protein
MHQPHAAKRLPLPLLVSLLAGGGCSRHLSSCTGAAGATIVFDAAAGTCPAHDACSFETFLKKGPRGAVNQVCADGAALLLLMLLLPSTSLPRCTAACMTLCPTTSAPPPCALHGRCLR